MVGVLVVFVHLRVFFGWLAALYKYGAFCHATNIYHEPTHAESRQ
jgi:hypothetical protein